MHSQKLIPIQYKVAGCYQITFVLALSPSNSQCENVNCQFYTTSLVIQVCFSQGENNVN